METRQRYIEYEIVEKDESGLIPDWVHVVKYSPQGVLNADPSRKIAFYPANLPDYSPLPPRSDREAWKEIHESQKRDSKRFFPDLTLDQTQKILKHLEDSLVDSE